MTDPEKPEAPGEGVGSPGATDCDEHLEHTAWQRCDGRICPWEEMPGVDRAQWSLAVHATLDDGLVLYVCKGGEIDPAMERHNRETFAAWKAARDAKWANRPRREVDADTTRKRALGLVDWWCFTGDPRKGAPLARMLPGGRDELAKDLLRALAPLVNDGTLSRSELADAVIEASQRCGHIPGNKTVAEVERDVDRAIGKFTEPFDWDAQFPDDRVAQPRNGIPAEERRPSGTQARAADDGEVEPASVYAGLLLTRSALRSLPEPEPLIDNVLDKGTLAYLYGRWGTLKTFIALDWALCVSTGKPWQGRTTARCRVLYVVGEGAFGFKGRVQAWETGWRSSVADEWFHVLPVAVNLSTTRDVTSLCALVAAGGYGLVVIDTLSRCMVGADENSAKDCGLVVDAMTRILGCTPGGRGTVLGVHHAGKDGRTFRGSSVFEAAADTVYFSGRDDETNAVTLKREKRKDGPENDVHELVFSAIDGTGSGVLQASHGMSHGPETNSLLAKLRLIWSQHFETTGATSADFREVAMELAGISKATYHRMLKDLVQSGFLINTGTDKRPFYMTKGASA